MEVKTRLELLTGLFLQQDIFINVQKGLKERYGVNLTVKEHTYFINKKLEEPLKIELQGYILGSIKGTALAIEVKNEFESKFILEEDKKYLISLKETVENIMSQFIV